MSAERFSGDFEADIAQCPFLGNLGEAALEAIRAEMELIQAEQRELDAVSGTFIEKPELDEKTENSVANEMSFAQRSFAEIHETVAMPEQLFTDLSNHVEANGAAIAEIQESITVASAPAFKISEKRGTTAKLMTHEDVHPLKDGASMKRATALVESLVVVNATIPEADTPPAVQSKVLPVRKEPESSAPMASVVRPAEGSYTELPSILTQPESSAPEDPVAHESIQLESAMIEMQATVGVPLETVPEFAEEIESAVEAKPNDVAILLEQLYEEPARLYENFTDALKAISLESESVEETDVSVVSTETNQKRTELVSTLIERMETVDETAHERTAETIREALGAVHGLLVLESRVDTPPELVRQVERQLVVICERLFSELGIEVDATDLKIFIGLLRDPRFIAKFDTSEVTVPILDTGMVEMRNDGALNANQWDLPDAEDADEPKRRAFGRILMLLTPIAA